MLRFPSTTALSTVNIPVSDGARALNIEAWRYADEHLTDGRLEDHRLPFRLSSHTEKTVRIYVAELLAAGVWLPLQPKGYLLPDYLDYNPTREQVLAYRAEQAEKGRVGAAVRWGLPLPGLRAVGQGGSVPPHDGWQRP